jgi:hypothetical protein
MPEQLPTTDPLSLVDRYVTELVLLTKEYCPDAFVDVLFRHYEDEDAHILVFVSEDTDETAMDGLQAVLTQRSVELLDDLGVLILVGVYEGSERHQLTGKPGKES